MDIWSDIGQIASTAWKNTCGTVAPLPMPRLGWLTSQAYLLLAEIGKYAIGHEMSNQQ